MIRLSAPKNSIQGSIVLSGSKSISNRLLVLSQVLGIDFKYKQLSDSEDTKLLQSAITKIRSVLQTKPGSETILDIGHAGTDMRFLTALLTITEGEWLLTGSDRMKQRPIGDLVTALRELGATINYAGQEGFPPLRIKGKKLTGGMVRISSDISSQFISALLLISPALENGIEIDLLGTPVSMSYIDMTISLLQWAGMRVEKQNQSVRVYSELRITNAREFVQIESDWSSASYWYSICALANEARLKLNYLSEKSLQPDSVLPALYRQLGVVSRFEENSVYLSKEKLSTSYFEYDFRNCPDLAQTVAVTCVGLGINARLSGLSTLKVKETDRIEALKVELEKLGAKVTTGSDFILIELPKKKHLSKMSAPVETYTDHRMAMSFAPLALVMDDLLIKDQDVVKKSYPGFWDDLKSVGFDVHLQA